MKNEKKLFCYECGRKLKYYTDENYISIAWKVSVSSHILAIELNKQNPDLPHAILRKDIKGFWYCDNEKVKHKYLVRFFDIKRYKYPIVAKTNKYIG